MRARFVTTTTAAAAVAMLAQAVAAAGSKTRASDIPVRSTFADLSPTAAPYTIYSDGGGAYADGVDQVVSVLMANVYNGLYNGDWEMDTSASTVRTVAITLDPSNAVPAGAAGYTVAANPPFWGTGYEAARVIDKCTQYGKDVLTLQAGATITCPLLVRWSIAGASYRLDMGTPVEAPETTQAQISCNSADAGGCNDWFVDPVPTINADGTTSPGQAIARLVSVAKNGSTTNLGDFYMAFHFHVTRP